MQSVTPHDFEAAVEHQPGRRIARTDIIKKVAGLERLRRSAGKTLGGVEMTGIQDRKHLIEAGIDEGHRISPERAY